tara:strand:- start:177 stop:419 length:243 start_codon:yes stop_codon:yes gene_type:complete
MKFKKIYYKIKWYFNIPHKMLERINQLEARMIHEMRDITSLREDINLNYIDIKKRLEDVEKTTKDIKRIVQELRENSGRK